MKFLPFLVLTGVLSSAASGQTPLEIPHAAQPQLAVAADGRVWLAYGRLEPAAPMPAGDHSQHQGHKMPERSGEIFVTSSSDGGVTFAPAVRVVSMPKLMLGMRRGPRIAAHGDRVTVTAIAAELIAFTSTDAGRTWSGPITINDVAQSAREGLHDLARAPDGSLFVTWLDLRHGRTELWGAISRDGGRSWLDDERVYKSSETTLCECCHPTALFDREGNLAVMWRNALQGNRDMWLATRARGAAQFAPARKLGTGSWQLNACPMDGGNIVALGGGRFAAVWQRAGEVFYSGTEGAETLLGKGKQPIAINRSEGPLVFWQEGPDLVSIPRVGAKPEKAAADARFAVLAATTRGTVVAFEQGPAKDPKVVVQVLR